MEIKFKNRKGIIVNALVVKEYTYQKTGITYFYVKTEDGKKRLVNKNKIVNDESNWWIWKH